MAESPESTNCVNNITVNSTEPRAHKLLSYTKSSPAFHSMEYLEVQQVQQLGSDGQRSRSSSAPLTREALKVAQDLRKASDNFVKAKLGVQATRKRRRITLGSFMSSSIEKEVNQATINEGNDISPLHGTPV